MGNSSDQLGRQIRETRASLESQIVQLRSRSRIQLKRCSRYGLLALGTGVVVGVAAAGAFAVYRYRRPATRGERLRRLLPHRLGIVSSLGGSFRKNGTAPAPLEKAGPAPRERVLVSIVRAVGAAAGTALASTLVKRLANRPMPQRKSKE
jgi:hypothetical protein